MKKTHIIIASMLLSSQLLLPVSSFADVTSTSNFKQAENSNKSLAVGSKFTVGDFSYIVKDGTNVATNEYIGSATDVSVPQTVEYQGVTYSVTIIGDHSMSRFNHPSMPLLTSVSLPEGITEIEYCGIENTAITSIHLPSTLTKIDMKAFNNDSGTPGINSITGGENVETIDIAAFRNNQIYDYSMFKKANISESAFSKQNIPEIIGSYGTSITIKKANNSPINKSNNIYSINKEDYTELIPLNIGSGEEYLESIDSVWSGIVTYSITEPQQMSINTKDLTIYQGSEIDLTNDKLKDYIESVVIDNQTFSYDDIVNSLNGVFTLDDTSTIDTDTPGTFNLALHLTLPNNVNIDGDIVINILESKQTISGEDFSMTLGSNEPSVSDFKGSATDSDGNPIDVTVDFSKVDFSKPGTYEVTLNSSDGQSKTVMLTIVKKASIQLVPVLRAYNSNDGDHLYTSSKEEYDWITGLKWTAEGVAFQGVLSNYEAAVPVYRLYNPNSGEHFYTVSESEYDGVASKGWTKEQVGFYMVPKEKGDAVYRVFNPNATGPGSHLFTSSKEESTWLINQGWTDEGIAFYSAK